MKDDLIGPERARAACQAAQIESYWHGLGHKNVRTWIEKGFASERMSRRPTEMWFVRSNLINGKPPE